MMKKSIILAASIILCLTFLIFPLPAKASLAVEQCAYKAEQIMCRIADSEYPEGGSLMIFTKFPIRNVALGEDYTNYYYDWPDYNKTTKKGHLYILDVYNKNRYSAQLHKLYSDGTSSKYVNSNILVTIDGGEYVFKYSQFDSMFCDGGKCNGYEDWIAGVWKWALYILIPLSVLVVTAAGVVWMTSEVSGVSLLLLGRLIFVNIVGVDSKNFSGDPQNTTTNTSPYKSTSAKKVDAPSISDVALSQNSDPYGGDGGFSSGGGSGGGGTSGGAN
jgi:hypothetical protein